MIDWIALRVFGVLFALVTLVGFVAGRGRRGGPGILATMPYIALQLVGMQVVLAGMGISGDLPLIIAFVILAGYTYFSGLRAPAMIALVKDVIIYITVIVAVVVIPAKLGGYGQIF